MLLQVSVFDLQLRNDIQRQMQEKAEREPPQALNGILSGVASKLYLAKPQFSTSSHSVFWPLNEEVTLKQQAGPEQTGSQEVKGEPACQAIAASETPCESSEFV